MRENDRPKRPSSGSGDSGPRRGRPSTPGKRLGEGGRSDRDARPHRDARKPARDGEARPQRSERSERSDRSERPRTSGGSRDGAPRTGARSDAPRRDSRPGDAKRTEGRPGAGRPSSGRPSSGRTSEGRPERSASPRRDAPKRDGEKPRFERGGGRPGPDREARNWSPRDRDHRPDRDEAPRHDDPPVDADALPGELDRAAWRELKALTKENAEWVAGHLVMASRVVDEDPERAHKHALVAARRAGRIPVVRETVGITAYLLGDFALALRELRTYRRLSGSNDQLPLMVDCERGLGRPDRALELASEVNRSSLPIPVQVELAIARSGARLDMGKADLARAELEIAQLNPDVAYSFSPALFDSYAVVLAELGLDDEADLWGEHADRAAEALAAASGEDDVESVTVVEMPDEETP